VHEVWSRVEGVLRATAPDRLAALPAGASPEAIAAVEGRLGLALPDDVRDSYAVHNGSGGADVLAHRTMGLIDVPLLSLDEVVRDRRMWLASRRPPGFDDGRAGPEGPIQAVWWNPRWVPVTWDGGGDHLCIDLDPAPGGMPGQVIYFSHEVGPVEVVAGSWRAYLEG
jgi:cell wall assembly regulator SMI1